MILNSTSNSSNNVYYDYTDNFPLSYDNEEVINRTYYDDYFLSVNQTFNSTSTDFTLLSSILHFSTPFSYIFLILLVYFVLTIVLLSFSLYKQRQSDIENIYSDEFDDNAEQNKRLLRWKQLLINRIDKGDMEPLLKPETQSDSNHEKQLQLISSTFPLEIV